MASNESLNARRARVAKLQQNAARKIARNAREKNLDLAGGQYDPRTNKDIGKMRSRDLDALERRLTRFNSRATQFERSTTGDPLPIAKWREYKKSEQDLRNMFAKNMEPVKNKKLPLGEDSKGRIILSDETIEQRQNKMRTKHPTAANMAYLPPERKPFNVKDLDSLTKLTKANKKRMTQKWAAGEHKRAEKELKQMVEVFEDEELNQLIKGMSKGQFDILWNFTRFADNMSITYHHYQKKYTPKQKMPQELVDNELAQAKTFIRWVKGMNV
jgi:hypothetical protein